MADAIDYAWAQISASAIKTAGYDLAVRYLGGSARLTDAERRNLHAAGVAVALVWETTADEQEHPERGASSARTANAEADTLGYPVDAVIFFADDNNEGDPSQEVAYFDGVKSVGGRPCGAYGNTRVIEAVCAKYPDVVGWQVETWVMPDHPWGFVSPYAVLVQRANSHAPYVEGVPADSYDSNQIVRVFPWWAPNGMVSAGGSMRFRFPFDGSFPITSPFGPRASGMHTGVDFGCPMQTIIRAAADGTVQYARQETDAGNTITLAHGDGWESRYHHLASFGVNEGDTVKAGQEIARSNNTGSSTGAHLHFEIRTDHDTPVDPMPYLIPPPPPPTPHTKTRRSLDMTLYFGQLAQPVVVNGTIPVPADSPVAVLKEDGEILDTWASTREEAPYGLPPGALGWLSQFNRQAMVPAVALDPDQLAKVIGH